MKTTLSSFLLVFLLMVSCNKKQEKVENDGNREFQQNLENSPKIFSKFWVNMSELDFQRITDTLLKERKIIKRQDSLLYKLDGHTFLLEEFFQNGELQQITLIGELQPIWFNEQISPYNLFKEKYDLPSLIKEPKYFQNNTLPNPDYDPVYNVYLNNGLSEVVTEYLIDNKAKKYRYRLAKEENHTRVSLPKSFELKKNDDIKILITEVPSEEEYINEDVVFSLEDWENKIPYLIKSKYSVGRNELGIIADDYKSFNDQKSMETVGNYLIRKNSKFVTKNLYQKYNLKVTYVTNDFFRSEKIRKDKVRQTEKNLKETIDEMNSNSARKKKKEALEEI